MGWMEACYGGTDVMERSCAVARGIDINTELESMIMAKAPYSYSTISYYTYRYYTAVGGGGINLLRL
jgi:hypothetical protein